MWVALADGPDDDDDDMGTEEGVGVKSPFFMRSKMVACREIAILAGTVQYTLRTGPEPAKLKNKTENHHKKTQRS